MTGRKPPAAACAVCSDSLTQPEKGRPRRYCSTACRRLAEHRIRRLTGLLATAERSAMAARVDVATGSSRAYLSGKRASAWAVEIEALEARLLALLSDEEEVA